ncbi:prolipoprotein diacylglyceryl transferase family protein [Sorangium sp. So ce426]|uniref:prolipoprotein diacylglyceryl transferase family protein n=1 Tax=Sorangium sp. So ce426 TaxID=3133312 RepID=UPI003F5B1B0E
MPPLRRRVSAGRAAAAGRGGRRGAPERALRPARAPRGAALVGELGPLHIESFGVLVAFGIFVGVQVLKRRSVREGLDVDTSGRLLAWVLVGGFLGAHLADLLVYFPSRPTRCPNPGACSACGRGCRRSAASSARS